MFTIRNYTDTKCELEMAKTRLDILIDKKTKLYQKYFPLTSNPKEVVVDGGNESKDMANYLYELYDVIDVGTGLSLGDELENQHRVVNKLQNYLNTMDGILSKMTGIEYQLFYEIIYNGVNVTQAVNNIAIANDKEPQTIWKYHYKKIKKHIKKINIY